MKIKSAWNLTEHKVLGEVNDEVSQTVPNMALTVSEILFRFTRGTLGNIAKTPYYDENADFDSIDPTQLPDFDLADYTALNNSLNSRINAAKNAKSSNGKSDNQNVNEDTGQVSASDAQQGSNEGSNAVEGAK